MGWKDAPIVEQAQPAAPQSGGKWQDAPVANQDDWERAVLLPMETNKATGERRWAAPGFIDAAIGAAALPGDVASGKTPLDPRVSYSDQDPETLDRAAILAGGIAGEAPMAARNMVRATPRNLVSPDGVRMPKLVADELEGANIAPEALPGRLAELGPSGVIGDLSPRLQARVGAVATTPGPGQDMVVQALMARQKGANNRIKGAIGETFGEEPIPSRVRAEIDASRQQANQGYEPVFREKALSGDFQYDSTPIVEAINRKVPEFVGETRSKVEAVRNMLFDPRTGGPVTDPQTVLAVRHELDGMIEALKAPGSNRTTLSALKDLRRAIDEDLATQIPGLKAVDARHAEVAAQGEAFDLGQTVLRNGPDAIHPVDLQDAKAAMEGPKGTLVGPRGAAPLAPQRLSEGTLAEIYRVVGQTANDRVALRQLLKGEGSWNREKLVTVFGEAKAKKLIELLDAEATMAQTEQMAFGNSKTEVVRSAKEGIEQTARQPGVVQSAANLKFGDAVIGAADFAVGGALKRARARQNALIADALMSRDGWAPAMAGGTHTGAAPIANIAVLDQLIERGKLGGVFGR